MASTGTILKRAMKKKGVTQVELAAVVRVTQPTVSLWCQSKTRPAPRHWKQIEHEIGIPASTWLPKAARTALGLAEPTTERKTPSTVVTETPATPPVTPEKTAA